MNLNLIPENILVFLNTTMSVSTLGNGSVKSMSKVGQSPSIMETG